MKCQILFSGKIIKMTSICRHDEILFLIFFFSQNTIGEFMQTGDNLHELSNPVFWENNKKKPSICHLLNKPRVISNGDNLHEMSNHVYCKK